MIIDEIVNTASDYSSYTNVNLTEKLQPLHNFIEQLLVRLEEFQILLEVAKRNQTCSENISLLLTCRTQFDSLFDRIDKLEELMEHMQSNLGQLEEDVIKTEIDLGFGDSTIKVSNIFSPLFKKPEKRTKAVFNTSPLNTQEYFIGNIETFTKKIE